MAEGRNLQYDDQLMDTLSKTITSKGQDFDGLLKQVHTQNETLRQHWQGADADSYTSEIAREEEIMTQLSKTIADIGQYIMQVKNTYQRVREENTIK